MMKVLSQVIKRIQKQRGIKLKKIALDFDGTIANTNLQKSVLVKKKFGLDLPAWQCDRTFLVPQIGEVAYQEIADIVYEREATLQTPPLAHSVEKIPSLAEKFDLFLLTARPQRRLEFAAEWLEKYRISTCFKALLSSHLYDHTWRPKLEICQEQQFDLLLEDDLRHLAKNGFETITKVLIKEGCLLTLDLPDGVRFMCGWDDFYNFCMVEFQ